MKLNDLMLPLWRRIPVNVRQRVAHSLLNVMTPALPETDSGDIVGKNMPRIIAGFLSSPSGLGQSARLLAASLRERGYPVFGIDLSGYFFEVAHTVEHGLPDGRTVRGPAHLIVNINAPYMPYVLWLLGRRFLRDKYITGYWAWELPVLPESWRRGFGCVHDIAVPSTFVADAVRNMDDSKNVFVLPHPVAAEGSCVSRNGNDGNSAKDAARRTFTVGFMANIASGFVRKNPLAVVAAFRQAFGNDRGRRLKMLLTNANHYPPARKSVEKVVRGAGNIEVTWSGLSPAALHQWWHDVDVYVSLHRSEGFGIPLAEAMCAGLPVVATGWSGNMEFMTVENSFPVRYSLVEVQDDQGKYPSDLGKWAEPDIYHAADLLRRLEANREAARRAGQRARKEIQYFLSAASIVDKYENNLNNYKYGNQ